MLVGTCRETRVGLGMQTRPIGLWAGATAGLCASPRTCGAASDGRAERQAARFPTVAFLPCQCLLRAFLTLTTLLNGSDVFPVLGRPETLVRVGCVHVWGPWWQLLARRGAWSAAALWTPGRAFPTPSVRHRDALSKQLLSAAAFREPWGSAEPETPYEESGRHPCSRCGGRWLRRSPHAPRVDEQPRAPGTVPC